MATVPGAGCTDRDPLAFARLALARLPQELRRQERCFTAVAGHQQLRPGTGTSGPWLVDFSSNDYLGLALTAPGGPVAAEPSTTATADQPASTEVPPEPADSGELQTIEPGSGAGASPLITGLRPVHQTLRRELGHWLGREQVLLFPSGFQANVATLATLADRHCLVLADRLCHYSLLLGVRASGATLRRFAHNNLQDLERQLEKTRSTQPDRRLLVVSESVFSMEATSPDVAAMASLCRHHGALLMLDEAHALGVLGEGGRGLAWGQPHVQVVVGTFGKALGSGGAMVAVDGLLGDYLLQFCGGYRYSTALAPGLAAAALRALRQLPRLEAERVALLQRADHLRDRLEALGYPRPPGRGPVLPLLVGSAVRALTLQQRLEAAGLLVTAIRPPTVPPGCARLRIVLRLGLPPETVDKLLGILAGEQHR